jgi:hypothetical protein
MPVCTIVPIFVLVVHANIPANIVMCFAAMQAGDVNEAALKDFAAAFQPPGAAAVGQAGAQAQLRSAVQDHGYSKHPGQVTAVAVSPFQVRYRHHPMPPLGGITKPLLLV